MNLGLLITVRLKSRRLPRKVALDLQGRSVLQRVIDRARAVGSVERVVVCTSTHPQDRPIADTALAEGVH